jgi:hypothetical protein
MLLIVCSLIVYMRLLLRPIMADGDDKDAHHRHVAFGARVGSIRETKRLLQERLGEMAGLYRKYVSTLERGQRNVGLDNIFSLADALGTPPVDLFHEL